MNYDEIEDSWFEDYPALCYAYFDKNVGDVNSLITGFDKSFDGMGNQKESFKDVFSGKYKNTQISTYEVDGVRLIPPSIENDSKRKSNKEFAIQAPSSIAKTWPYKIGTLGAILELEKQESPIILTCAHVLLNAEKGDPIQVFAGNKVVNVARFINSINSEFLDFAIARVEKRFIDDIVFSTNLGYYVNFEGKLRATKCEKVGYAKKKGSMSAIGKIENSSCKVKVNLENGNWKLFKNQIVVDRKISSEGDSGSIAVRILDKDDMSVKGKTMDALGLVFAEGYVLEGNKEGERTFMNPIIDVYSKLKELLIIEKYN